MQAFNQTEPYRISPTLLSVLTELDAGGENRVPHASLIRAVAVLSRRFTKDRGSLDGRYLDDRPAAAAYRAYFLPVNLAKVQMLLDELPYDCCDGEKPWSVLDLGSGPGTGSLGVLDWICRRPLPARPPLQVMAVDHSSVGLRDAAQLWETYCRKAQVSNARMQTCAGDLEKIEKGPVASAIQQAAPYDVIILANCLNEVFWTAADPPAERATMVASLVPLLKPQGTLMLIEPALRETARDLHRVRDLLLRQKIGTVYSPCLHEQDCPALVHRDDWCHEERAWDPPAHIQAIDRDVGLIKDALKFSYLLLRTDGRAIVERQPNVYRVVSELREFKGEKRAWLCNESGRPEVGRLDRLASPQNAAVDLWHRGAIVQIERIVRKEREGKVSTVGRIEREAAVRIVRSV